MVDVKETEKGTQPKQDRREEIVERVTQLREKVNPLLEEDGIDPAIVERLNQIFNDTMAAIPPDPKQDPPYQRATITTTMAKLKTQVEAALAGMSATKEHIDKFKQPFVEAEEAAKQEDKDKQVPPPAGPSQSPMDLQQPIPEQQATPRQPPKEQPGPDEQSEEDQEPSEEDQEPIPGPQPEEQPEGQQPR